MVLDFYLAYSEPMVSPGAASCPKAFAALAHPSLLRPWLLFLF